MKLRKKKKNSKKSFDLAARLCVVVDIKGRTLYAT